MKSYLNGIVAAGVLLAITSTQAQMGGPQRGPQLNAAMSKLFGQNSAFTADVEVDVTMSGGEKLMMPGKAAFDSGKSRFEVNLGEVKGTAMPAELVAQMKTMGMDRMIMISRPDKKVSYAVYPGLKAYAQQPMPESEANTATADLKIESTELGKETVAGHPTVKTKSVVTDSKGEKHEFTTWNATDMKNFPIRIESTEDGNKALMTFSQVKLAKPEAAQFEPPSGLTKYDNIMAMMQQEAMKRMGGGAGGMPGGE